MNNRKRLSEKGNKAHILLMGNYLYNIYWYFCSKKHQCNCPAGCLCEIIKPKGYYFLISKIKILWVCTWELFQHSGHRHYTWEAFWGWVLSLHLLGPWFFQQWMWHSYTLNLPEPLISLILWTIARWCSVISHDISVEFWFQYVFF